jgi:hypothetical protein
MSHAFSVANSPDKIGTSMWQLENKKYTRENFCCNNFWIDIFFMQK